MASKVASVKLGLDASGFKRELNSTVASSKVAGSRIGGALRQGMSVGTAGGIAALKQTGGQLRSLVAGMGAIVSVAGFVGLAKGVLNTEAQFKRFAQTVKRGTGEVVDWRDALARAQQISDKLGKAVSSTDVGASMQALFTGSGSKDFAMSAAEDVATAALGSGEDINKMTAVAGDLYEKFGVSAEDMKYALNDVVVLSQKGGVSFDELASGMERVGASAKQAGIQGKDGFTGFLGMLNVIRDSTGTMKQAQSGVASIIERLESGEMAKAAKIEVGVDIDAMKKGGADFTKIVSTMVAKANGDTKKLAAIFGIGGNLQAAQALGGLGTTAEEIQAALKKAATSATTWEELQANAAENANTGAAKFDAAMETLRRSFEKPEMIAAINSLAGSLPALAKVVADVVGFAVENPAAGAALGGAAIFGKGFAEAAITGAIMKGFSGGGGVASSAIEAGIARGGSRFAVGLPVAIAAGVALTAAAVLEAGKEASERDIAAREEAALKNERAMVSERGGGGETGAGAASDTMGYLDGAVATADEIRAAGDSVDVQRARQEALDRGENPWAVEGVGEEVEKSIGANGEEVIQLPKAIREKSQAWEEAKLVAEEDADWDEYAKANGIDDASLAMPAAPAAAGAKSQQGGGFDAAQARLLAEMLGGKELKVRIMNPQDISNTPPGGAPPPGRVPRP